MKIRKIAIFHAFTLGNFVKISLYTGNRHPFKSFSGSATVNLCKSDVSIDVHSTKTLELPNHSQMQLDQYTQHSRLRTATHAHSHHTDNSPYIACVRV